MTSFSTEADATMDPLQERLLDAALPHVPFDGWSAATLRAAAQDADVEEAVARSVFPRGPVDLALAYHARGDREMVRRIRHSDMSAMRFRDKIAAAVRHRIEAIDDKEAVRRGTTLFALPIHAPDGARAVWGTADRIWTTLGDGSSDINWYTKRATLTGVYGSTILYWLGDESPGYANTWDFLDRRIDDVMQVEKVKAQVRDNPVLSRLLAGPNWLMSKVKAPARGPEANLPGAWTLGAGGAPLADDGTAAPKA